MVDNVAYKSDAGATIATFATDDAAGVHYQYVKNVFGADNTQTLVTATVGMPVNLIDIDGTAPSVGSGTADAGTFRVSVSTDDVVQTSLDNTISTNNSTTTPLGVSGNFTGTGDDVSDYASVTVHLYANVASAASGMTFEFADENTFAQPDTYTYTMAADENRRFQFPVTAQFFRVNYTNGGTGQTTFIVQTIFNRSNVLTSVHRAGDNVDPDRSAQLTKSIVIAQAAGSGDFIPVQTTASGNFKMALEEIDAALTETEDDAIAISGTWQPSIALNYQYNGTQWVRIDATALAADGQSAPVGHKDYNFGYCFNGATWDRIRGDATDGLLVNPGANNDVHGQVAHDSPNTSNNPFITGFEAIAHGTNPTAVAAADVTKAYANRAGIPFVIGGHPNVITHSARNTGANTDQALITIGASTKIVVTRVSVTCDNSNSVDVDVEVGFGATTVPTAATGAGVAGMIADFMGIPAGGGITIGDGSGILGVGADGEDLRYSNTAPTSGNMTITVSYYTIES